MPSSLLNDLLNSSENGFLPYKSYEELSLKYNVSYYEIEKIALEHDIFPLKYKRNLNTISCKNQLTLLNSKVAIVGCGGLGGNVSELLARIGIGNLLLVDFDIFEEHNLNRQNYSNVESIGKYKVDVAKKAINKINPSVKVSISKERFDGDFERFYEYDVIVDALDDPQLKVLLAEGAKKYDKNFVHGAIGGFNAQFLTNSTLENLYKDNSKGAEIHLGNLSFIAAFAASVQVSEVIKILLGIGENLKDKILITDLLDNEFFIV